MPTQTGGTGAASSPTPGHGGISDEKGPPMRFLPLLLLATPAHAHTGHIADLGGHDHWVLGVGLGVIAGAAVLGWLKGGKKEEKEEVEDAEAEESPT